MLGKLSFRSIKRQFADYSLYFMSLVSVVSFMYAFNTLIFSESVKKIAAFQIVPYMIAAVSVLVFFILGYMIRYMTDYILKKRSRELAIYMLSGISNKGLCRLVFFENMLIGGFAFVSGLPVGIFRSSLLEAALLRIFGISFSLHFRFSLQAEGLTFCIFMGIFMYMFHKNKKWICRISLKELLYYGEQNEKYVLSGQRMKTTGLFILSLFMGVAGFWLMLAGPFGKGYDVLVGMILLVLFLFGFFMTVPSILAEYLDRDIFWKYSEERLIVFRKFASKIQSMSMMIGILTVLFMISNTCFGMGTAANILADKCVADQVFDVMVLHREDMGDFSSYANMVREQKGNCIDFVYGIYTGSENVFRCVCDKYVRKIGDKNISIAEFQYDTYMRQSDYLMLRQMLGYEEINPQKDAYYVHCLPVLANEFSNYIEQNDIELGGYKLYCDGIFSEPFAQNEAYGNGLYYVVIVPDEVMDELEEKHFVHMLYSIYAALTESSVGSYELSYMTTMYEGLVMLEMNEGRTDPRSGLPTYLCQEADYLSGKWVRKETFSNLYALLFCLFYLALIMEIAGTVILTTQILGDADSMKQQENILRQLGMSEEQIRKWKHRYLRQLFIFPVIPAFMISCCLVHIGAAGMQGEFLLPVFTDDLWVWISFGAAAAFFCLFYGIYYFSALIRLTGKKKLNIIKPRV